MKLFILTTDQDSLDNSDHGSCEIIARRDGKTLICDFETYPERTIKVDFNPMNGMVNLSFTLAANEFLAVGTKDAKKTKKRS